ncbi:hypothetical protein AXF42_Ash015408 [Apostasia shenzhenica]|uniref:Uncharacterized protein n=1 Tax=Apostasia shenzhenica TaxID=1088818 RepID=A0A2H9ZS47_9ASPA|nr:hypothetical protein AXF42_Ash015408 [Apostasia shenzhenica]
MTTYLQRFHDGRPEPPFVASQRIKKQQQYFQYVNKPIYLKGRYDMIMLVAIPLALATTSIVLTVTSSSSMHLLREPVTSAGHC